MDDQTWKPTIACSNQAMLLLQRHVFFSLLALKPVTCPTMCPQTFVPFVALVLLFLVGRGLEFMADSAMLPVAFMYHPGQHKGTRPRSWTRPRPYTPTVTVSLESSRNVVNWTRHGLERDARNRTSQSGDPGEKTPGGAGTHRHTGHTRLSKYLTTNPSTHQHAHCHDHATTPETTEPHGRPNPDKNPAVN